MPNRLDPGYMEETSEVPIDQYMIIMLNFFVTSMFQAIRECWCIESLYDCSDV